MEHIPRALDQSYVFMENCVYWNSMEKTLLTLNVLLLASFALFLNALIGGIPYRVVIAQTLLRAYSETLVII